MGHPTGDARVRVVGPLDAEDLSAARVLFGEYAEWLSAIVTHTTAHDDLASLPGAFTEADCGRLLVGATEPWGEACGVVGVKRHSDTACEIKRLYVREACRGGRLGHALFAAALDAACELGYSEALVATIPAHMPVACQMYERLGFTRTRSFEDHTHEGIEILYLRLDLGEWCP